jgi:MoxR-like ATPase
MSNPFRETYHFNGGLEQAVVDLVRVGSGGHASGVRQLATRLVHTVPPEVDDPDAFRVALRAAIAPTEGVGLRFGAGEVPTEDGTSHELATVDPHPDGAGLVLAPDTFAELREIVEERRRSADLIRAGVPMTHTVLLSGAPGVGKSMAARWLASELEVPLVSVDLATVVSSFLGSSGRNIRSVLSYAKTGRCVLLLDEFDALAKRRDDETDIGELKRIVNVILLELDRWPEANLLVAATNHPDLLDRAIDRRFDRRMELRMPELPERRAMLCELAAGHGLDDESMLDLAAEVTRHLTGSDIRRLWDTSMRRAVLQDSPVANQLLQELSRSVAGRGAERDRFWLALSDRLKMSSREIASLVGVSHPTVGAALKRARTGAKT